ncbi:hypothetical protein IJ182_09070 [bacterium]|nr:hypothetical protein [bacterium]
MQLLEVKSNIAKILYNPSDNHLLPSDFLLIDDTNQKLIAQIINISTTENSNNNLADVRLILSIDKEDNLSYYNGYIPLKTSNVVYINPDEIVELIKGSDENIYLGNLSNHGECFVKVPISCVDDRLYIQSDRYDKIKTLIQNISAELVSKQKKIIIFDFNGQYSIANNTPRLKISESFKLPLNIEAFNNIIEYDTTDCPIEDKAVIQSIVLELREYIKTVDHKFLPFTLFKTVIDNEFSSNPISGLMLLRNKLWLYAQEGIFAESKTQFEIINNILDNQNILIIDASKLEDKWYKFAIQTIQNLVKHKCYFVISLNDLDVDKKTITSFYNNPAFTPIVSTSYDSKYRQILKSICKNQILFKPSKQINDEEEYSCYINRINSGEFIIYGESELYIPLILDLQAFNASTPEVVTQNDIKKDVDKFFTAGKIIPSGAEINNSNKQNEQETTIVSENTQTEESEEKTNAEDVEVAEIDDDINDNDLDFLDEQNREQISIDDIRNKLNEKPKTESEYDIFSPVKNKVDIKEQQPADIETNVSENSLDVQKIELEEDIEVTPLEILPDVLKYNEETSVDETSDIIPIQDETDNIDDITNIIPDENKALDEENILVVANEKPENITEENKSIDKNAEGDELNNIVKIEENSDDIDSIINEVKDEEKSEETVPSNTQEKEQIVIDNTKDTEKTENKIADDIDEILQDEDGNIETISDNEDITSVDIDEIDELKIDNTYIDEKEQNEKNDEKVLVQADDNDEINIPEEDNDEISLDEDENVVEIEETEENTEKSAEKPEEKSPEVLDEELDDEMEDDKDEETEISAIDDIINDIEEKASQEQKNDVESEDNESDVIDEEKSVEKQDMPPAPPLNGNILPKEMKQLPNYEADISAETMEEIVPFKVGDRVYHPKHGNGKIVGFAQYSNKILFCRIDFENEGIRILDPRVSVLEKI